MGKPKPAPLRERDITRQIAREYYKEFDQLIESDVIIVGAGPSGLICAHDLAAMGFRTVIVDADQTGRSGSNNDHIAFDELVEFFVVFPRDLARDISFS